MSQSIDLRKYVAEFLATLCLTLAVYVSLTKGLPIPTPVVAALTVGLFVYSIGAISGAHINPAVTIGLFAIGKVPLKDSILYIVAQYLGATIAMVIGFSLLGSSPSLTVSTDLLTGLAEAIGAFILVYGIGAVVHSKVTQGTTGVMIGGSLLLGILVASSASNGVLNPAVAFGIGSFGVSYVSGPIIGGILGAATSRYLHA